MSQHSQDTLLVFYCCVSLLVIQSKAEPPYIYRLSIDKGPTLICKQRKQMLKRSMPADLPPGLNNTTNTAWF
jgi:hypothetical protein